MGLKVYTTQSVTALTGVEISLLEDAARVCGRATLLVPSFAERDVCRRALADARVGMGVDVTTPEAWIEGLWELFGDGRRVVSSLERRMLVSALMDRRDAVQIAPLRDNPGTMRLISQIAEALLPEIAAYAVVDAVKTVTCREAVTYEPTVAGAWGDTPLHVALLDLGCKNNIVRCLQKRGCRVTVLPGTTTAAELAALNPDGLMLSNGPGDPAENVEIIANIREILSTGIPTFGICLGHQLTALAAGAKTCKMKYGHRGANHPVKDLKTGRVYISSQNHGYVVDTDKLDPNVAEPAFINVNDGTNEGLKYVNKNIFTVQFHPEACPGPQDSAYLFDRFINMMGGNQ